MAFSGGIEGPAASFPMRLPPEYRGQLLPGQQVTGRILGFYDGKAVGVFNGIPLLAETTVALKAGETINALVTRVTDDQVFIKLVSRDGDSNPIFVTDKNVTDILENLKLPVNETSQSIVRGLMKFNQPLDFKTIAEVVGKVKGDILPVSQDAELVSFLKAFDLPITPQIKDIMASYLFRSGNLGQNLSQLQNLLGQLQGSGGIPSGELTAFLDRFQATLNASVADPALGASDIAWRLPALMEAIGFDQIRKMAAGLINRGESGINEIAGKTNLLGTLLGVGKELQALTARLDGEPQTLALQSAKLAGDISKALTGQKIASSSSVDYFAFQIPLQLPDGLGDAQIRVGARKEREKGNRIDPNDVQIAFLLHMTKLGSLRVDVKVLGGTVSLRFLVESNDVRTLVDNEIVSLKVGLEKQGYSVSSMATRLAVRDEIDAFEWGHPVEPERLSGIDVII